MFKCRLDKVWGLVERFGLRIGKLEILEWAWIIEIKECYEENKYLFYISIFCFFFIMIWRRSLFRWVEFFDFEIGRV